MIGMLLAIGLSGCGKGENMESAPEANRPDNTLSVEDSITDENMVFDYYEAAVATVGGNDSEEYVLYKYDDDQLILASYSKQEDSEETMYYRLVPVSVLDDCMKQVKNYKMRKWKNVSGLTGRIYVVKFMDKGEMIRVSSDYMPDNGIKAFDSIRGVLVAAWSKAGK